MKRTLPLLVVAILATIALVAVGRGSFGGLRLQVSNGSVTAPAATAPAPGLGAQAAAAPIVPPAGGSRVDVTTAAAARPELGYTIGISVVSPAGKPVNDATIRFYDVVDFFGQREALIGSAVTDGQGRTAITYLPATTGTHLIVARFAGQGSLGPSLGTTTFEAATAAPPYRVDEPRLAAFSRSVPYAAGAVVLAVWSLIALALLGTARGVVADARNTRRKEKTA